MFWQILSILEGLMIVSMLGWEIFWLRKMYQVLWNMPTSSQVTLMIEKIEANAEPIKQAVEAMFPTNGRKRKISLSEIDSQSYKEKSLY